MLTYRIQDVITADQRKKLAHIAADAKRHQGRRKAKKKSKRPTMGGLLK